MASLIRVRRRDGRQRESETKNTRAPSLSMGGKQYRVGDKQNCQPTPSGIERPSRGDIAMEWESGTEYALSR